MVFVVTFTRMANRKHFRAFGASDAFRDVLRHQDIRSGVIYMVPDPRNRNRRAPAEAIEEQIVEGSDGREYPKWVFRIEDTGDMCAYRARAVRRETSADLHAPYSPRRKQLRNRSEGPCVVCGVPGNREWGHMANMISDHLYAPHAVAQRAAPPAVWACGYTLVFADGGPPETVLLYQGDEVTCREAEARVLAEIPPSPRGTPEHVFFVCQRHVTPTCDTHLE